MRLPNSAHSYIVISDLVISCYVQLIVSVRPSAPPHNPSSVFHGGADDVSGGGGSSLNDDTKKVLKVC